ncbi:ribose transport system ATP-binding protein [Tessaracoccus oleiagri]|uniref:Ribose transport system ATP-binding protein n=2 Tax=Tessaracoccus oleiagri TaxID=686624 RepID=A0A1G9HMQ5_9ACTN|nr:ribose transport system ATP-binding protein [Tessaracoccus oleiagri]
MVAPPAATGQVLLTAEGVSKAFGGAQALRDVSVTIRPGVVHGFVGANGAGKSTLIRILAGVHHPDSGSIHLDGQEVHITTPLVASQLGLAFIHQEMSIIPGWDVLRNMALGMPYRTRAGIIDWKATRVRAAAVAKRVGIHFSLDTLIDDLSTADKWLVMIARALMQDARLIAMDEPTASLSPQESNRLHEIIRELTAAGTAVIFVSHRLAEVSELCEDVTVFKDGRVVRSAVNERLSSHELVQAIVGRRMELTQRPEPPTSVGDVVLDARHVSDGRMVKDVSLQVRAGEVVGLGGLVGSGRTEFARLLYGAERMRSGDVALPDGAVRFAEPADAVAMGLGMVPEERRSQGVFLDKSIDFNINLASLNSLRVSRFVPWLKLGVGRRRAERLIKEVGIKTRGAGQPVGSLSGGNQQKVALARWLAEDRKVLILDEPSRGVDVGARAEIHNLIRELAARGAAVLVVSSDNEELVALCDRVVVMADGHVCGEVVGDDVTIQAILALSFSRAHHPKEVA